MFHLSVKPISRAAGRSATAAAAYRSGQFIVDARTGEVHDYTRKSDIVHSEILVPAGSPAWAEDRTALWNAAEAAEKRKDARVARDYEVAIPKDLTRAQGIELVRDFSAALVDRYGVAVDFNIHRDDLRKWDGTEKGWQGYHAHILTSTRKLGRSGFGEKAEPELSDTKRKSLGLSDGAAEIEKVRQLWEVTANRHLEQAGVLQRIDSRSLKDQGIDRDPTVHLGSHVTGLERGGIPSRLGDINRKVAAEHQVRVEARQELKVLQPQIEQLEREVRPAQAKVAEVERPRVGDPKVDNQPLTPDDIKFIHQALDNALAKIYRERDQRVQRVLAKAQRREQRREKAYRTVQEHPPVAPRGLLATFQQKGHQQAVLAWQASKEAAAKLVEQAKRLGQRLLEAKGAKRLMAWSQETLKRQQPELVARRDDLVRKSATKNMIPELQKPQQLEPKPPIERVPFSEQPGFDPRTPVDTRSQGARQPEQSPAELPPKDIKVQAAEGVAAFRARLTKERQAKLEQRPPEKTYGDKMLERLKAQVEAEQKAAEAERSRREQTRGSGQSRSKGKDGPEMGD